MDEELLTETSTNEIDYFSSLVQLSQLNNRNDQMYKRALDNSEETHSKIRKTSKMKDGDLSCVICEDIAIGFNYDALTCASCKAFFRRNAKHNPEKVRCSTGENNCSINYKIVRKCQRCRLKKCLLMGMRKDFIISEEEKQRRKQRIEENMKFSQESLQQSTEIDQIQSNYISMHENTKMTSRSYEGNDRTSALIHWSEFASERSLKLISFFRTIEQFEQLNNDDRFILIKYNLYPLYIMQKCLFYDPSVQKFQNRNPSDQNKRREFFRLCYGSTGIIEKFKNLIHSLSIISERDSKFISILSIILLFSKGLSINENEPCLNNSIMVYQSQSYYVDLIWNYFLSKYGSIKTIEKFIQLIQQINKLQFYTKYFREFFQNENQSSQLVDKLAPLMQTVLNIN